MSPCTPKLLKKFQSRGYRSALMRHLTHDKKKLSSMKSLRVPTLLRLLTRLETPLVTDQRGGRLAVLACTSLCVAPLLSAVGMERIAARSSFADVVRLSHTTAIVSCRLEHRIAELPSGISFVCVAPNSGFAVWVTAVVLVQSTVGVILRSTVVNVRHLRIPSLAQLSRSCPRLTPAIIRIIGTLQGLVTSWW